MVGWACTATAYFGVSAVLFNLYLVRLGFGPEFIGLLSGAGQFVWALCALLAGVFSRRFGLRTSLLVSAAGQGLGMLALLCVESLPREIWPAWLLVTWMAQWALAAPLTVSGAPLLMQVTPLPYRRQAFTAQAIVMGIVAFLGSLLAGHLPGWLSGWVGAGLDAPAPYRTALFLIPVCYLLAFPLWSRLKLQPLGGGRAEAAEGPPRRLLLFVVGVVFLQTSAEGALRTFYNVYLDRVLLAPVDVIGQIGALAQVVAIATALAIPRILGRLGNTLTLCVTSLGAALAMIAIARATSVPVAGGAFVAAMALMGIGSQARQLFSQELVAPEHRTQISATNSLGVGLGWATMSGVAGLLVNSLGYTGVFGIGAILAFGAAATLFGFSRRRAPAASAT